MLVGGYVRDELLGRAPKDADIEVYGLQAPELRATLETLGRVDCVGESFRVYKLVWHARKVRYELDVSLPRRDRKTGEGHKGFEVEGDPFASFEDAARRRDFTLNAILRDPLTGEIIDPFGGQTDLKNRELRAVDPTHFGEDSLRVLRAMQFAGRFGLSIEAATATLCRNTPLADLPAERVWGEWEKWLLKSPRPSLGLVAGSEIGVFRAPVSVFTNRVRAPWLLVGRRSRCGGAVTGWVGISASSRVDAGDNRLVSGLARHEIDVGRAGHRQNEGRQNRRSTCALW